jgi:hypothetical protein
MKKLHQIRGRRSRSPNGIRDEHPVYRVRCSPRVVVLAKAMATALDVPIASIFDEAISRLAEDILADTSSSAKSYCATLSPGENQEAGVDYRQLLSRDNAAPRSAWEIEQSQRLDARLAERRRRRDQIMGRVPVRDSSSPGEDRG